MIIEAPYPDIQTATLLPNPDLLNSEGQGDQHSVLVAMDKSVNTYIKTTGKNIFNWSFLLTKEKALELREFVKLYSDKRWRVTDHNDDVLIGHLLTNPLELEFYSSYTGVCTTLGYSLNERTRVELEFETL